MVQIGPETTEGTPISRYGGINRASHQILPWPASGTFPGEKGMASLRQPQLLGVCQPRVGRIGCHRMTSGAQETARMRFASLPCTDSRPSHNQRFQRPVVGRTSSRPQHPQYYSLVEASASSPSATMMNMQGECIRPAPIFVQACCWPVSMPTTEQPHFECSDCRGSAPGSRRCGGGRSLTPSSPPPAPGPLLSRRRRASACWER